MEYEAKTLNLVPINNSDLKVHVIHVTITASKSVTRYSFVWIVLLTRYCKQTIRKHFHSVIISMMQLLLCYFLLVSK